MLDGETLPDPTTSYAPGPAPIRTATCRAPTLGTWVVERPEVVGRLLGAGPRSLVLVTGAAASGKTTLAGLWARHDPRPFAWVALDHLDDDPAHLVAHVATALAEQQLLDAEDLRFLCAPGRSPLEELVPALAEILDRSEPFVLVVDDVHVLVESAATTLLAAVVEALPPTATVALLSRAAPLRGTARRRLHDQVLELRAEDLALAPAEARKVLDGLGVAVDGEVLDDLVARCEGWAGGIHLAALALRQAPAGGPAPVTGRNRLIASYLAEEVLDGLDPELARFAEEASLVAPMSADLLDDVLDRDDSAARLTEAEEANLFLVPLDEEGEWFRFHHLFGELLEARLRRRGRQRPREIHRRAAEALTRRHDLDGAVRHSVAAGEGRRGAALIGRDAAALALSGRGHVLGRRLALLDPTTLAEDPQAAVARAWCALAVPDVPAVREALADAVDHDHGGPLPDGSTSVRAAVALLRAMVGDDGLDGVIGNATTVIDAGGRWEAFARAVRGSALLQQGHVDRARSEFLTSLAGAHPVPGIEASTREFLAWIHVRSGDLTDAVLMADSGRSLAERHELRGVVPLLITWALDAAVAARVGDRARAADGIAVAEESLGRLGGESPRTRVFAHQVLADAHQQLGEWAEARRHLGEAVRIHRSRPLSEAFDAENARLARLLASGPTGTMLEITPLTGAEQRLLPHLATHLSLPQIARELGVSRNTVKTHCMSVYRKMGVTSRSEAVAEARRLGLIDR